MIHSLLSTSMESNAYVVSCERTCVIDPGLDASRVLNHVGEDNIGIDVLINTHCHFDHVGANPGILKMFSPEVSAGECDAGALETGVDGLQLASLFGAEPVRHRVDRRLRDGDVVDLGGVALEVLHTPGHTPGSICLYERGSGSLFTGDTVFATGVGRTDFQGGSWDDLEESLRRLEEFVDAEGVETFYPGHGPPAKAEAVKKVGRLYF